MKWLWPLVSGFAFLFFARSSLAIETEISQLSQFNFDGKSYIAIVIGPAHPASDLAMGESEFAEALRKRAAEWRLQRFHQKFPEIPTSFFASLEQAKIPQLERTASAFIYEDKLLSGVSISQSMVASLEVFYPDEAQRAFSISQYARAADSGFLFDENVLRTQALTGLIFRLGSFALEKEDFLPLLYFLLEMRGMTDRFLLRNELPIFPSEYRIECFRALEPYYRRLGFLQMDKTQEGIRKLNESLRRTHPLLGRGRYEVIEMKISREGYLSRFAAGLRRRPGILNFRAIQWDHNAYPIRSNLAALAEKFGIADQIDFTRCKARLGLVSQNISQIFPPGTVSVRALVEQTRPTLWP